MFQSSRMETWDVSNHVLEQRGGGAEERSVSVDCFDREELSAVTRKYVSVVSMNGSCKTQLKQTCAAQHALEHSHASRPDWQREQAP